MLFFRMLGGAVDMMPHLGENVGKVAESRAGGLRDVEGNLCATVGGNFASAG